jgi:FkbM family methyltransferase
MPLEQIKQLMKFGSEKLRRGYVPAEELAYRRLRAKGFSPAAIIDVGAYQGGWTRLVRRVFPEVPVLMIEAQAGKKQWLERVCRDLDRVRYVPALLGARSGETVPFFEMETGSSMFPENSNVPRIAKELTTTTLDELVGPDCVDAFLKIDVQGAELEVLRGSERTLSGCEVVQLEVALLPYNEGAPTMLDVLTFMDERQFAPFDISGFSRPNGVDLAQVDLLFARSKSPLRRTYFTF